ncbi:putative mucin/carbohydrate-binding domain-containing protein [Bacillus cereus group sp. TH152-1LC]|uniref:putative mucin/carbohydrate-binding domain-containing protein n=1 Tax=Bacillus cereus group sp. TH152-1LC TaxID=3018060 RepID=UPI0022E4DC1C|nr:putative mucin/carbohydrate-binding domain-containing protein [Bacillus cereus group sp. TH152-1LC]MDA1679754.1 M60 family metallopeptidase [Bacillus cereus group sp. TH152-1LC]
MSKKKTSRVLVAGICISTLLSPVAFEASKGYAAPLEENKGGKLEEVKENKFEQRTFHVPGKGDIEKETERLKVTFHLSVNEPTGIYAAPNEKITIEIKGNQSIQAFIGTRSYDEKDPEKFDLKPGKNVISSSNGGILYFYNMNDEGEVTASVTNGGSHFPLFILGKHTKKDFDEMLKKYKDPYAVELKGERSLITASYSAVQDHMNDTDPTKLMKLHDKIIRLENAVAGLSEDGIGVVKSPNHYVQFVEKRNPDEDDFMFATNYHTGYIPSAMNRVLDIEVLEKDGWGPWHEVGHLHQQRAWDWDAVGEVTVNIYSLAVQKALGNKLDMEEHYEKSFEYLQRPIEERVIDEINPLTMFWQLNVVYGEHFYPRLHQAYRLLPQSEMPASDEEKKQMFVYMTSKVAGQNLIPFFEEWGLTPNDDIREKIEKLNLPKLEKEIWKATDSNDIREKQVEAYEVPYGEPSNEMRNLLVGTDFDENEASKLVQKLGENVKVTGNIIWPKLENGKQEVLVEIEDEKGNKNLIPVQVNGIYGDSIIFQGLSNDVMSTVMLHHNEKKLNANFTNNKIHYRFENEEYMGLKLYDRNGIEKKSVLAEGQETGKRFALELNGVDFEYGDVVKVFHAEPSRLKWYQNNKLADQGEAKNKKGKFFKITPQGFELKDSLQEVTAKPQQVVVGTNIEKLDPKAFVEVKDGEVVGFVEKPNTTKIGEQQVKVETKDRFGNKQVTDVSLEVIYGDSIAYVGYNNEIASVVTLKHEEQKLHATDMNKQIHKYFDKEQYMGITLYDQNGTVKKHVTAEGQETSKNFAEQVNGVQFEYGDVVKVFHAEPDRLKWYQNNTLTGQGEKKGAKELFFKVTEKGFEKMDMSQEVTAKPQQVVVGTDVEKLDAKNFVEVKAGEVIGFVEKPNTTKLGEQKVKVETKDIFGNKQVTEVSLEVTYGDSLVFKGIEYTGDGDIKSVVTLQHDKKKFSATDHHNKAHGNFKEETYFEFALLDATGKKKKKATVKGVENTEEFAKTINGLEFEYGDVVKIYHAEADRFNWYQNNNFAGQGKSKVEKELLFKVTEKGFERMKTLQEVKAVPQKVVIGTNSEKLDAKNFVEVKDGEVIGFVEKPITTKIGEQKVKVETKDRFGNKQVTEVLLEVTYGDSIAYVGFDNEIASVVTLKHEEKKLHVTDMDSQIHKYFNKELYMGITLYAGNGTEKKHVTAEGQETSQNFAEQVNGLSFEYGDVVKVFHAEPDRLKWYQNNNLAGQGEKKGAKELFFKVTEKGFEKMDMLQEVKAVPQKLVIGTNSETLDAKKFVEVKGGEVVGFVEKPNTTKIGEQKVKVETKDIFGNKQVTEVPVEVIYGDSIMFFGTWHGGTNIKSIVTLNHDEKKFSTTNSEGPMHTSFADEKYMEMTVYDKAGKEKKALSVKASENTKAFAEQFNGMTFEYGDVVKVYQKEFDRFKVYKKNEFVDKEYGVHEVFFKVTEQGFERMETLQEVKVVPQKVVIGTNSEKLDAKKFVEVNNGEVVGFVEKPDTTNIGKQTVKVETKDRFGSKKVTEVAFEVTYGDSLVYQGLYNDITSIVTLNHEGQKLHVTYTNEQIHSYFKNELYMGITLYDQNGIEKKYVTAEGQETSKNFAEQVNGTSFQYGDVVKVYHAESDRLNWYKKSELVGKGDAKKFKEISFKITPNGLEQVQ